MHTIESAIERIHAETLQVLDAEKLCQSSFRRRQRKSELAGMLRLANLLSDCGVPIPALAVGQILDDLKRLGEPE